MRSRLLSLAVVVSAFGMQALGAQAPVKTIEDGVLDKIELFVASPGGKDLVVVMKPDGLFIMTYRNGWRRTSLPSTWIRARSGSTRVPSWVTTCPSTVTLPD